MSDLIVIQPQVTTLTVTEDLNQVVVSSVGVQGPAGATGATGATGPSGVIAVTAPITNSGTSTSATIGVDAGSTSTAGVLQLTDSVSSTSTTTAATPNAVKSAYDLAVLSLNMPTPISGSFYRTISAVPGSPTASVNTTTYQPIEFNQSVTLDRIAIHSANTFSGTASVRLGIFANNGNKPGDLILDAGTVAPTTSSTSYAITINQTLSAGMYWVAMNSITAAATNAYLGIATAQTTNSVLMGGVLIGGTNTQPASGYSESYTATTTFANASSPSLAGSTLFVFVRVA